MYKRALNASDKGRRGLSHMGTKNTLVDAQYKYIAFHIHHIKIISLNTYKIQISLVPPLVTEKRSLDEGLSTSLPLQSVLVLLY